jgi:uncharacterized protein (UPF0332 family)
MYDDAVTRSYYAACHWACALLLTEDVEAASRRAVHTLLSQHFVRSGKLSNARVRDLKRLQGFREAADYDRHFRFDAAGAEEEAIVARRFVAEARQMLAAGGWLAAGG